MAGLRDLYVANGDANNQLFVADGTAGGFVEETQGPVRRRLTAAIHMDNPYCSCKLSRVRSQAVTNTGGNSRHTAVGDLNGDGLSSHGHLAVNMLRSLTSDG